MLSCLVLSVASLFLPILTYQFPFSDEKLSFNIISFAEPAPELTEVLATYTGPMHLHIDAVVSTILAAVAALAIVAAFVGVITMSMQRHNTWQFILALVGIIGTMIPSILIIAAVILSGQYFPGDFRLGAYPIITPITMILCLITVTGLHRRSRAEREAMKAAEGLIRRGGNL
ncbi:MAG: hypothetical protein IJX47_01735 [Clostridia bacterium]|nr:hypothetical protein [Clostridia bacterium]